ncbi:MAG: uroporphyrinogen-III synthase [Corticimicrobacter sp.]|uniref:uroporphyrinogen-III synthase n=1 Tax=Corticimicrobacter sp. TaxID=2678536 RepID=UPI0032DA9DB4
MRRAVLTRPQGRNETLAAHLVQQGWQVLMLPAMTIEPLDHVSWRDPADYDLVMFVSGNAARLYVDGMRQQGGHDWRWPSATLAAMVGPGSADALRATGVLPSEVRLLYPSDTREGLDSEALWRLLQPELGQLRRVLIVRGEQGRDWLAEQLHQAGIQVDLLPVYRRVPAAWTATAADILQAWQRQGLTANWLLSSIESFRALHARVAEQGWEDWWRTCCFITTHPRITQSCLETLYAGARDCRRVVTSQPLDESLLHAFLTVRQAGTDNILQSRL